MSLGLLLAVNLGNTAVALDLIRAGARDFTGPLPALDAVPANWVRPLANPLPYLLGNRPDDNAAQVLVRRLNWSNPCHDRHVWRLLEKLARQHAVTPATGQALLNAALVKTNDVRVLEALAAGGIRHTVDSVPTVTHARVHCWLTAFARACMEDRLRQATAPVTPSESPRSKPRVF